MIAQQGIAFGKALSESEIKRGLLEMNPDLHFDLAAAIGQIHPMIGERQGVYLYGRHLCSMDRGMVPEFKIWTERHEYVEAQWAEADLNTAKTRFRVIRRGEDGFLDKREIARTGRDNSLMMRDDGAVVELTPMKLVRSKGRVHRLGWRHTFEALLRKQVPGVTRSTLSTVFHVDMLKYPVGSPDEVAATLLEE